MRYGLAILMGVFLALFGARGEARAQESAPLGEESFDIDSAIGPVLAGSRVVGLGGAYSALAEGITGAAWNPASLGARSPWEQDFFEFELTLSASTVGLSGQNSLRSGELIIEPGDITHVEVGLRFQWGPIGVGALGYFDAYTLTSGDLRMNLDIGGTHLGAGWSFDDGAWVVGVGARYSQMTLRVDERREGMASLFRRVEFEGYAPTVGVLYRPHRLPWRAGLSLMGRAEARQIGGTTGEEDSSFRLPRRVVLPAEAKVGFAYQWGERPMNWRYVNYRWLRRQGEVAIEEASCERMRARLSAGAETPPETSCRRLMRRLDEVGEGEAERQRVERETLALRESLEERQRLRAERLDEVPRRHHLLTSEVGVVGRVDEGIPADAFLAQQRLAAGRRYGVILRVGYETEPIHRRLALRVGAYLEPSRVRGAPYRPHITASLALRAFHIAWWEADYAITALVDYGPQWLNVGIGLSTWH